MVEVFSIFATLSLIEFKMFAWPWRPRCSSTRPWSGAVALPAGLDLLGDRGLVR